MSLKCLSCSATCPPKPEVDLMTETIRKLNLGVPAILIALSMVPIIGGTFRLAQMAGASIDFLPESDRILAAASFVFPLHIVSSTIFCIFGAFQFSTGIRHRWPKWHRKMGLLVAIEGLFVAMSGLWLTLYFPPAINDNTLLYVIRIIVSSTMASFILFGLFDAIQRDFNRHQAWMMRGYALGAGAGTQVVLLGPWTFLFSGPDPTTRALLMGTAWVINLCIAGWFINKKQTIRRKGKAYGEVE